MNLTNPNQIDKVNNVIKDEAGDIYVKSILCADDVRNTILSDWFVASMKREAYMDAVRDIVELRRNHQDVLSHDHNDSIEDLRTMDTLKRNSLKYFEPVIELNEDQESDTETILSTYNKIMEQTNVKQKQTTKTQKKNGVKSTN